MAKIINLEEMLEIACDLKLPGYESLVLQAEAVASAVAESIATMLCVKAGPATWEGKAFAGLCARFHPAFISQACPTEIDQADSDGDWENLPAVLNDRYADTIIGDRADDYDALEIHGVRDLNEPGDVNGTCCEVDDENPQFYATYAHLKMGGIVCVGDFGTNLLAEQYARELAETYGWQYE